MTPTTATLILQQLRLRSMTARTLKTEIPSKSMPSIQTALCVMVRDGLVEKHPGRPLMFSITHLGRSVPPKYLSEGAREEQVQPRPAACSDQLRAHETAASSRLVDRQGFPLFSGDAVVAFALRRAPNSVFALGARTAEGKP